MQKEWETAELIVLEYRETKTCVVKVEEQISQMLDDHIVMTQVRNGDGKGVRGQCGHANWECHSVMMSQCQAACSRFMSTPGIRSIFEVLRLESSLFQFQRGCKGGRDLLWRPLSMCLQYRTALHTVLISIRHTSARCARMYACTFA